MNKSCYKNVRVFAENNEYHDGFNIYVELSGQREFVMCHRHNAPIYWLLTDGVWFNELKRCKPGQILKLTPHYKRCPRSADISGSVRHLIRAIDEYLQYRDIA